MEIVGEKVTVSVVGDFRPIGRPEPGETKTPEPIAEEQFKQFKAACRAIGQALAESNHPIVLCAPDWGSWKGKPDQSPLVCDYVVDGASEAQPVTGQRPQITVYHTRERVPADIHGTIPDAIRGKKPDNVNLVWKPLPGPEKYESESFPSVKEADTIILISGGELSEYVACAAHYVRGMPVVAITSFGGAAAALYRDVFLSHYEGFASGDARIRELFSVLDDTWDEKPIKEDDKRLNSDNHERARRVVDLTGLLYRANEIKKKKENRSWRRLVIICAPVLFLWIFVFTALRTSSGASNGTPTPATGTTPTATTTPTPSEARAAKLQPLVQVRHRFPAPKEDFGTRWRPAPTPTATPRPIPGPLRQALGKPDFTANFWLWCALGLAATLGMLLRTVVAFHSAQATKLDWAVLWTDVAAGILLAMGFGLVYFMGGWSFTNDPRLPSPESPGATIPSVVAALSIIGLAAGFLLPVEALRKRLHQYISNEKPAKET